MELILTPTSLADRNELANAPYIGACIARSYFVPARWCDSAAMRGYVTSCIAAQHSVATHETALWIHTGRATPALERGLAIADSTNNTHGRSRRSHIPPSDIVTCGSQRLTSPERTAVDLLMQDIPTGISYMLDIARAYPAMALAAVQRCAWSMSSARGIRRVRAVLDQLADLPTFPLS
ncbi:MAG: hypothetical protein PT944_00655 [Actinomycetaceae bacterium]|nr:hypothetical protein [Arcanobacterium sp.]MDD7686417.1 hypothetical protein [Actinomycetaceae bacterium]MDY5272697.1 hypothetical protein [Arcanobacterium sp.]